MGRAVAAAAILLFLAAAGRGQEKGAHPGSLFRELPLPLEAVVNGKLLEALFPLEGPRTGRNRRARRLLRERGFLVMPDRAPCDRLDHYYSRLKYKDIPLFITSDTILAMAGVQLDLLLRRLERQVLCGEGKKLAAAIFTYGKALQERHRGELGRAADLLAGYGAVALSLARGEVSCSFSPAAAREVSLVLAHRGPARSPLFGYSPDYSAFEPRGHYAGHHVLEYYFRTTAWLGTMGFLLEPGPGMTAQQARVQTLAAALLAVAPEPVRTSLARLTATAELFLGPSRTCDLPAWRRVLERVLGEKGRVEDLTRPEVYARFHHGLSRLAAPPLRPARAGLVAGVGGEEVQERLRAAGRGLHLLGWSATLDLLALDRLTCPLVTTWRGKGKELPFSGYVSPGLGPVRGYPRALDLFHLLGSPRAALWLDRLGDDDFRGYEEALHRLRVERFSRAAAWPGPNLTEGWLHALTLLLREPGPDRPAFMRSTAWADKQLTAATGGWTRLCHTTTLLRQWRGTPCGPSTGLLPRPPVTGYLEPVPHFYRELRALLHRLRRELPDYGAAVNRMVTREIGPLGELLGRLDHIARQELARRPPGREEREFFSSFPGRLGAWSSRCGQGGRKENLKITLAADVFTNLDEGRVVQECLGPFLTLFVLFPTPGGGLALGAGPVLSHHEFKQPAAERLTDRAWRRLLRRKRPPRPVPWMRSYTLTRPLDWAEVPAHALSPPSTPSNPDTPCTPATPTTPPSHLVPRPGRGFPPWVPWPPYPGK